MKYKKDNGFLMIEAAAALGIISIFMSMTAPVIKNSIELRNAAAAEIRYGRNYLSVIQGINKEIENADSITILNSGSRLELINKIYENKKISEKRIIYYFTINKLKRYSSVDMAEQKEDIVLENVKGLFFEEDSFIKLKIKYKNREEEYVYGQK